MLIPDFKEHSLLDTLYKYITLQQLIWCIPAFLLMAAVINGILAVVGVHREKALFRGLASFLNCALSLASLIATASVFFTLTGFESGSPSVVTGPLYKWAVLPQLVIDIGLKLDQLSLVLALLVTGSSFLVQIYSVGFMAHEKAYSRHSALTNFFVFFVLIIVLADNMVLMFAGWQGAAICSWLMIAFWFDNPYASRAGTKAFVIGAIGDAAILAGMFLVYGVMSAAGVDAASGAFGFDTIERYGAYFVPVAGLISVLFFIGAAARSAQIPFFIWLPDAMVAPVPCAALISSAAMLGTGVYMIVRLNLIFAISPGALSLLAVVGAASVILAAFMGLVSNDLKKILAYSTISQLGYMFLACGVGAFSVAVLHLVSFTFFQTLLFLCAGSVIMMLGGESDIRRMGGLKSRMPLTTWTFVVAAAALAGIAPASGFFSRHAILWQAYERGHTFLWIMGFLGEGLTAFYVFRAAGSVFFGETNVSPERLKRVSEAPMSMAVPILILATLSSLGGALNVPGVLGGENRFVVWLSELISYEMSHAPAEGSHTELILMSISLLWSVHFSILGWIIYAQKRAWPVKVAGRMGPVYKFAANYFYIDRAFELLIAKPIVWISRKIIKDIVDETLIGGFVVGGLGRAAGFAALAVSALHNGELQRYLLYFLIGAAAVIGYLAL